MAEKDQLLSGEDADQELPNRIHSEEADPKLSWLTRRKVLYFVLLTLILAISTAMLVFSLDTTTNKRSAWKHCGNSTSEARANRCRFDIMMHSWVPQGYYDEVLSEEYIAANDFQFFSDAEATIEVPLDVVRLGGQGVVHWLISSCASLYLYLEVFGAFCNEREAA
ncbi:hypothetical protein L207DRAFT_591475 [Hyaloscypha variabilis F]|uniref:Uncharacterized protein n=1 Tax=Hyaloscypha variabilis (strain UAMH 11265 / GT02V1 / F) TaxID=1149755 RepID=A0A2J6QZ28_HYAVF|nr:hypothetical protein L207DRAFT_591475 [Hyaloscypha variabilis F]